MKRALITGITGQDGSYLLRLLKESGYEVHGLTRDGNTQQHAFDDYIVHQADLGRFEEVANIVERVQPDEVYNLAAQSSVAVGIEQPLETFEVTGLGLLHVLEAVRTRSPRTKVFQAGSAEMFAGTAESPQSILTRPEANSPYGVAKSVAFELVRVYREMYGLYAVTGILYNHESPRRPRKFLSRKVTYSIAEILCGQRRELQLGNLEARRDWGFAGDYVLAMKLGLAQESPGDFIIASGVSRSVREFVDTAFTLVDLHWEDFVTVDSAFFRPADAVNLCGDISHTQDLLGWFPHLTFERMLTRMLVHDLHVLGLDSTNYPRLHKTLEQVDPALGNDTTSG